MVFILSIDDDIFIVIIVITSRRIFSTLSSSSQHKHEMLSSIECSTGVGRNPLLWKDRTRHGC